MNPAPQENRSGVELLTIGHSNQPLAQFLALLARHRIEALVDIRRFPSSRKFPHFNRPNLAAALEAQGVEYHWLESLGGRRGEPQEKVKGKGKPPSASISPNAGLRNASFRNYADYMLTEAFRRGIDELLRIATSKRTAIMCSEAVFWRCHRRLVSDFLLSRGAAVEHIFPDGELRPHAMTEGAQLKSAALTYPAPRTLFD